MPRIAPGFFQKNCYAQRNMDIMSVEFTYCQKNFNMTRGANMSNDTFCKHLAVIKKPKHCKNYNKTYNKLEQGKIRCML